MIVRCALQWSRYVPASLYLRNVDGTFRVTYFTQHNAGHSTNCRIYVRGLVCSPCVVVVSSVCMHVTFALLCCQLHWLLLPLAVLQGEQCELGAACPHSHHVFESWLHPQKFRTMLCKDGDDCHREVCFFAHGQEQLRVPTRDMPLGGPSRPRGPASDLQQPLRFPAAIAAATAAANNGSFGADGHMSTVGTGNSGRHVRFQFPLMHAAGSVGGHAAALSNAPSLPVMSGSITNNLLGSAPSDTAAFKDAAAPQTLWGPGAVSIMPIASGSVMPSSWPDSCEVQAASARMQLNSGELFSGNLVNSGTLYSGGNALQPDVGQLLNAVQQNSSLWRNLSAPDGALPNVSSQSCRPGAGRAGSAPLNSTAALSDNLTALLLQQQLGQLTTSSEQGVHQGATALQSGPSPQPNDAVDVGGQQSMLQKLQAQVALQDAAAAAGLNQIMSDASSMSTNMSFAQSLPETTAAANGASWESFQQALSGSAGSTGCSPTPQGMLGGACLVPSSSSLLPTASASPAATDVNSELLTWLQAQRLAHGAAATADGGLPGQQSAAQMAPTAALQITDPSMMPSANAAWTAGGLLSSMYSSTAGSAQGWLNQNQLASEYLSQLQQDVKRGGFLSAPQAMYVATDGTGIASMANSGGRMSMDTASSYAALLRGVHAAGSSGPGTVALHSAAAAIWPAVSADPLNGGANNQEMFLQGYSAAGGSKQLGWL